MWLWIGGALAASLVDAGRARDLADGGALVLDARDLGPYLWGHVPGAVRVDWRVGTTGGLLSGKLADPETAAAELAAVGVDDGRPILVVGAWEEGWGEEGRLAWNLAYLGHPDVYVLRGGMAAWDGPRERLPSRAPAGRFTPRPQGALRATADDVRAGGALVVDVREPEEYAGVVRHGAPRGGHVPGARNLPWRDLVGAPSPDLPRDTPIVLYCTGGVRSAMAWLWLRELGYERVANYDGSWWEWSRGPD